MTEYNKQQLEIMFKLLDALAEFGAAWDAARGDNKPGMVARVVVQKEQSLDEWSALFIDKLKGLGLPTRIFNALIMGASITTTERVYDSASHLIHYVPCEPRIEAPQTFAPYGTPLDFDEWCNWVLLHRHQNPVGVRNFSIKSEAALLDAIVRYLNASPLP